MNTPEGLHKAAAETDPNRRKGCWGRCDLCKQRQS